MYQRACLEIPVTFHLPGVAEWVSLKMLRKTSNERESLT